MEDESYFVLLTIKVMKLKKENYIFALLMILLGVGAIYYSKDFVNNMPGDAGPSFYPIIVSVITIILAIILMFNTFREQIKEKDQSNFSKQGFMKVGIFVTFFFIYFYVITRIGFIISTIIFMSLFMLILGLRDWKKYILIPIGTTIVMYYIFSVFLKIRLPEILF